MPRERKLPVGMQKRGNVYYSGFRAGGRLIRKRLSEDFKTACMLLRDLKARADRADFDLLDNDHGIADLKRQYLAHCEQVLRPKTVKRYRENLANVLGGIKANRVNQITTEAVIAYRRDRLAAGSSPRSINMDVGALSTMLRWGVNHGLIGSNPIEKLKPLANDTKRKQRRPLTAEEVLALFNESPEYLKPVWRMFMTTGIRHGELVNMRFDDVDFARRSVVIRSSTAKNHKAREIPLDDAMLATIARLRDEAHSRQAIDRRGAPGTAGRLSRDHVFVTGCNTPWQNNLLRAFYTCCKRAKIDGAEPGGNVDIHSLRVSFTTLALDHGANPRSVQAILGHSTLSLTMGVDAKATDRSKRDAIGALPFATISPPEGIVSLPNVRKVCASPSKQP